jgi:hypothetical protein
MHGRSNSRHAGVEHELLGILGRPVSEWRGVLKSTSWSPSAIWPGHCVSSHVYTYNVKQNPICSAVYNAINAHILLFYSVIQEVCVITSHTICICVLLQWKDVCVGIVSYTATTNRKFPPLLVIFFGSDFDRAVLMIFGRACLLNPTVNSTQCMRVCEQPTQTPSSPVGR